MCPVHPPLRGCFPLVCSKILKFTSSYAPAVPWSGDVVIYSNHVITCRALLKARRGIVMNSVRLALALVLSVFWANIALALDVQPQAIQSSTAWTNQSGSTLYIESVNPTGQITGHYINRAQGYGCQNTPYPATGWIYGTAITFTVKWENAVESCNSVTSWTGFYYQGAITTLWQLVINGSTSKDQIIQGEDIFKPTEQKNLQSLKLK